MPQGGEPAIETANGELDELYGRIPVRPLRARGGIDDS